jgi:hypothetical protein
VTGKKKLVATPRKRILDRLTDRDVGLKYSPPNATATGKNDEENRGNPGLRVGSLKTGYG